MTLLKRIEYDDDIEFESYSSQQFATVIFEREEDESNVLITVIKDRKIKQFDGNSKYNPSARRRATCVYVKAESDQNDVIKICTIQHKGSTLIEIHSVDQDELDYLF